MLMTLAVVLRDVSAWADAKLDLRAAWRAAARRMRARRAILRPTAVRAGKESNGVQPSSSLYLTPSWSSMAWRPRDSTCQPGDTPGTSSGSEGGCKSADRPGVPVEVAVAGGRVVSWRLIMSGWGSRAGCDSSSDASSSPPRKTGCDIRRPPTNVCRPGTKRSSMDRGTARGLWGELWAAGAQSSQDSSSLRCTMASKSAKVAATLRDGVVDDDDAAAVDAGGPEDRWVIAVPSLLFTRASLPSEGSAVPSVRNRLDMMDGDGVSRRWRACEAERDRPAWLRWRTESDWQAMSTWLMMSRNRASVV